MSFNKTTTLADVTSMALALREIRDAAPRVKPSKIIAWNTDRDSVKAASSKNDKRLGIGNVQTMVDNERYAEAYNEMNYARLLLLSIP